MMPRAIRRPCTHPGCSALVDPPARRCPAHTKQERVEVDIRRGSAASRGYDSRWRSARAAYLSHHPLCALCRAEGRYTPASDVDHIRPHRGNDDLFWDQSNWQPLCHKCHSQKTAREDGRWGDQAEADGERGGDRPPGGRSDPQRKGRETGRAPSRERARF